MPLNSSSDEESPPLHAFSRSVARKAHGRRIILDDSPENCPPARSKAAAAARPPAAASVVGFVASHQQPQAAPCSPAPPPGGKVTAQEAPTPPPACIPAAAAGQQQQQQQQQHGSCISAASPCTPQAGSAARQPLDVLDPFTPWLRTGTKLPLAERQQQQGAGNDASDAQELSPWSLGSMGTTPRSLPPASAGGSFLQRSGAVGCCSPAAAAGSLATELAGTLEAAAAAVACSSGPAAMDATPASAAAFASPACCADAAGSPSTSASTASAVTAADSPSASVLGPGDVSPVFSSCQGTPLSASSDGSQPRPRRRRSSGASAGAVTPTTLALLSGSEPAAVDEGASSSPGTSYATATEAGLSPPAAAAWDDARDDADSSSCSWGAHLASPPSAASAGMQHIVSPAISAAPAARSPAAVGTAVAAAADDDGAGSPHRLGVAAVTPGATAAAATPAGAGGGASDDGDDSELLTFSRRRPTGLLRRRPITAWRAISTSSEGSSDEASSSASDDGSSSSDGDNGSATSRSSGGGSDEDYVASSGGSSMQGRPQPGWADGGSGGSRITPGSSSSLVGRRRRQRLEHRVTAGGRLPGPEQQLQLQPAGSSNPQPGSAARRLSQTFMAGGLPLMTPPPLKLDRLVVATPPASAQLPPLAGGPARPSCDTTQQPAASTASRSRATKAPGARLFARQRHVLAQQLYDEWNASVFDGQLPADLAIVWNARLTATAGQVVDDGSRNALKTSRGERIPVRLELSAKVLDCEPRLRCTLAHEMCHVGAWALSREFQQHHGPAFWSWARRFEAAVPDIKVTTCHSYDVHAPFRWQCSNHACGKQYHRHKRSINTSRHICSRCSGRLLYLGKFSRDGRLVTAPPGAAAAGTPGGGSNVFAQYVKQHFADVKRSLPAGTPHKEVMGSLAARYKQSKANATPVAAAAAAAAGTAAAAPAAAAAGARADVIDLVSPDAGPEAAADDAASADGWQTDDGAGSAGEEEGAQKELLSFMERLEL